VTLAIKNFMGIPALKDSLPHWINGSPEEGGDQYINPCLRKRIGTWMHDRVQTTPFIPVKFFWAATKKILWNSHKIFPFKDDIFEAMWYGNDTIWRTLFDLNRGIRYADKKGKLQDQPQRTFFGLIDGIIAGERDGPVGVDPVHAGALLAGYNPVALDVVGATIMGHDVSKIPMIRNPIDQRDKPLPMIHCGIAEIEIVDGTRRLNTEELARRHNLRFEPHPNWKGHVELPDSIASEPRGEEVVTVA